MLPAYRIILQIFLYYISLNKKPWLIQWIIHYMTIHRLKITNLKKPWEYKWIEAKLQRLRRGDKITIYALYSEKFSIVLSTLKEIKYQSDVE